MDNSHVWYIDERAIQLAIVYLTRRDDLLIYNMSNRIDYAFDLLVRIVDSSQSNNKFFGVEVKGRRSVQTTKLREEISIHVEYTKNEALAPIPLCVFLFNMTNDEGFYTWLIEPVINKGLAQLFVNTGDVFKKLDTQAIHALVTQVDRWYTVANDNLNT